MMMVAPMRDQMSGTCEKRKYSIARVKRRPESAELTMYMGKRGAGRLRRSSKRGRTGGERGAAGFLLDQSERHKCLGGKAEDADRDKEGEKARGDPEDWRRVEQERVDGADQDLRCCLSE